MRGRLKSETTIFAPTHLWPALPSGVFPHIPAGTAPTCTPRRSGVRMGGICHQGRQEAEEHGDGKALWHPCSPDLATQVTSAHPTKTPFSSVLTAHKGREQASAFTTSWQPRRTHCGCCGSNLGQRRQEDLEASRPTVGLDPKPRGTAEGEGSTCPRSRVHALKSCTRLPLAWGASPHQRGLP